MSNGKHMHFDYYKLSKEQFQLKVDIEEISLEIMIAPAVNDIIPDEGFKLILTDANNY